MSKKPFNKLIKLLHNNANIETLTVSRSFLLELLEAHKLYTAHKPPTPPPARAINCFGYETKESKEATEAWRRNNLKKQ